jgi:hypothetical protein
MGSSFNDTQGLPCCGASALEMTPELLCGSDHRSTSPVTASLERSEERAEIDKGNALHPGSSFRVRLLGCPVPRRGGGEQARDCARGVTIVMVNSPEAHLKLTFTVAFT